KDDEAENRAFCLHDEAELFPRLLAHEVPHVGIAEPAPESESDQRADGEADSGVDEPEPLPEHEPAEDARDLAGDGRHHHLQGLDEDEDDGRGRPPFHELVPHELAVVEEAVEEAEAARGTPDAPDPVRPPGHRDDDAQRPPGAGGQSRPSVAPDDLTRGPRDPDRSGRTSRSAATTAAGRVGVPPALSAPRTRR